MIPLPPGVTCERTKNGNVIGYKWLRVVNGVLYSTNNGGDEWNMPRPKSDVKPTANNDAGFYFAYSSYSSKLADYAGAGRRKFKIEFQYQHPDDIIFHKDGGRAWKVERIHGPLALDWIDNLFHEYDWLMASLVILVMIVTAVIAYPFFF